MRVVALVDGEHYPPVTRWGLDVARTMGHEVIAALFLGGTEKVAAGAPPDLGVPTTPAGANARETLAALITEVGPDAVLDLSDEPIIDYRARMTLAATALAAGVTYLGADFRLDPPFWAAPPEVPTIAVIGTGKRTGKTAVAGEVARAAVRAGRKPVIVAMGRGGPPAPQVAEAGSVTVDSLLDRVERGEHAASDYLEDALLAGVTAVGARRCGGGLAGMPFATNASEAATVAAELGADLIVLEGSGSSVPPMRWDAGILVTPSALDPEYLGGYLGPLRVLLSDLVLVTMAPGPNSRAENLSVLRSHVQRLRADATFLSVDFQPVPTGDVRGKTVFLTTTAVEQVGLAQAQRLEQAHGCRVVGHSFRLSDRAALASDLDAADDYEVLLTELKAAAVDVAARQARERGAEVMFLDNRPTVADPSESGESLEESIRRVIALAAERHSNRN